MTNFKSGYTLIEILVALSIVGLIFSAGFVNFRDFSRRQLLVGTLRTMKGDLRLAQEYALTGKKPEDAKCAGVNILDTYGFFVSSVNEYVIRANCSGGTVDVKIVSLPADIEVTTPSPNPVTFKVLGEGTNITESVTITLTQVSTGNLSSVTVTSGGEIK